MINHFVIALAITSTITSSRAGNVVEENAPGIGGWGGTCRCPDGNAYQVGDNNNHCASLACINGNMGDCNRHDGPWSRRKVTCACGSCYGAKAGCCNTCAEVKSAYDAKGWAYGPFTQCGCQNRCLTCQGTGQGVCQSWCSFSNWCGDSDAHQKDGTDCRLCAVSPRSLKSMEHTDKMH